MGHGPALDARTGAKRGRSCTGIDRRGRRDYKGGRMCHPGLGLNRIEKILISTSFNFFGTPR